MMNLTTARLALRTLLEAEGANSIWITANVVQARSAKGAVMTLVRSPDEAFEELLSRAVAAYRSVEENLAKAA